MGVSVAESQEHNLAYFAEFHREKREQRRQILTLIFLGWLMCLLILQIHHPLDASIIANFGDLNVVWSRFVQRVLAPFTSPEMFDFGIDSLGWIIGATATILVALVFSGRNPLGIASEAQAMALDELLELLTFLVGIAAAATMWMALHNVFFLPSDPDSGPKFFLALLCLMLVIFSVVRQRDATVQREMDEFHLTTSMRLHTRRWERMWGVSARNRMLVEPRKIVKLGVWWAGAGLIFTLATFVPFSGFPVPQLIGSAVVLVAIAVAAAASIAAALSLYRSNPHPGVGLAYALVLIVIVVLTVVSPLAAAAIQNEKVLESLLGYFLWLAPSLLLIFRKPQSAHMGRLEYRMAARPSNKFTRSVVACFDGARECAYWIELTLEAHRQKRYEVKLAKLEADQTPAQDS